MSGDCTWDEWSLYLRHMTWDEALSALKEIEAATHRHFDILHRRLYGITDEHTYDKTRDHNITWEFAMIRELMALHHEATSRLNMLACVDHMGWLDRCRVKAYCDKDADMWSRLTELEEALR